jgi:hypothetical protein
MYSCEIQMTVKFISALSIFLCEIWGSHSSDHLHFSLHCIKTELASPSLSSFKFQMLYLHVCKKFLGMFWFLTSWNEFVGMLIQSQLVGCFMSTYMKHTQANNYIEHIREYNWAMVFTPIGAEIKLPPGNGPYCFWIHSQIYHFISPLYPKEKSMSGHG